MPVQAMIENFDRKKLCWNCEGDVLRSTANCPFCGVYLHPEEDQEEANRDLTPPYKIEETEEPAPRAPYTSKAEPQQPAATDASTGRTKEDWKVVVLPLLLLMSGSMFLLFGVMMVLFSHHGYFTIRWDASYWFYYILASIPLLYFGWRAVESEKL